MTLKADLHAMAEEAAKKLAWPHNSEDDVPTIESALHAAVKRVMEQPTMGMWDDFSAVYPVPFEKFEQAYRAMTAQFLKELNDDTQSTT